MTQNEMSQAILKAQLVNANEGLSLINQEVAGCPANWSAVLCRFRQIAGAQFLYTIGDYVSDTATYFYNTLLSYVGLQYPSDVVPDPNAEIPGTTFIINNNGSVVTSTRFYFTNATSFVLSNYQAVFYSTYGSNPSLQAFVSNGDSTFSPDNGNAPVYTYVTPGDDTSGIDTITFGWPVATTGYIQLMGVKPS